MQISSISPIQPLDIVQRHADLAQARLQARAPAAQPNVAEPKPFTPAPPLRPNVQDYVDIDRTLIELRHL